MSYRIKYLRTKLTAVAVVLVIAVAGRLGTPWVSELLRRRPTPAAPQPPTYGSHALNDEDPYVRLRSVQALGALNLGNAVVPMFAEVLAMDDDPLVRAEAAKHIIMDPLAHTTRQVLYQAIEDDHPLVRRYAVMALARIGDAARPALSRIEQLLHDPDEYARCAAATAIHVLNTDHEPPIPLVVKMLDDEDPITRQWAAAVLGDLRAESAIPALRELLQAPKTKGYEPWNRTMEDRAREEAERALEKINPPALPMRPSSNERTPVTREGSH